MRRITTASLSVLRRPVARVLPFLVVASLAAAMPSLSPRTETALAAYEVRALTVDVMVGPDGETPCRIAADLYRPKGATASSPAPAILTTHGFGGTKLDQRSIGAAFADDGYVVLAYSGLGFGGSSCRITLDDPDWDGKAGAELVSFLAGARSAVDAATGERVTLDFVRLDGPGDPRVGMVGGSYGGQNQFATAAVSGKVDALVPIITWNDLSYSIAPNNGGAAPGVFKKQWGNFFFGLGIVAGAEYATVDPARATGCPNFPTELCAALPEAEVLGYPNEQVLDLLRHASVASYANRVTAPTLLIQGQRDTLFTLREATATYESLKSRGVPASMVWQSWGHSHGQPADGELDFVRPRASYLGLRITNWFDRWLRDDLDAATGPEFEYYRDWVGGDIAKAYARSDTYPVGSAQTLYLSGTGALVTAAPLPGVQSYVGAPVPTSYSETSALEGNAIDNEPSDGPGTFAAWTSRPLDQTATIVGTPTLDVRLNAPTAAASQASGPGGQLVLFAKLYDVAPDGSVTLKDRLVSPVRVADVTRPVRIELPTVAQRFAAGHRIRLVLAASDAAYGGNTLPHVVSVAAPGVLRLPVVGARIVLR